MTARIICDYCGASIPDDGWMELAASGPDDVDAGRDVDPGVRHYHARAHTQSGRSCFELALAALDAADGNGVER